MATKKVSTTTKLKNANIELAAAHQKIAKMEKEVEGDKRMKEHFSKQAEVAEGQLQQIHAFLDAVPNPPARKTDPAVTGSYGPTDVGALTRLTVFLATR